MIYLARHGETTWNLAGRYQGRLESALSALGVRQGLALAQYFADRVARGEPLPTRVISSPLLRCTATARFTAERLDMPVEIDERLLEIAHGTWEGRLRDELAANDPERYRTWREDPAHVAFDGGETLGEVDRRWREFAASLPALDGDALVVTHDAVVRVALLAATNRPLDDFWAMRVENAAFALLACDRPQLSVIDERFVDHLDQLRASVTGQAL
ncbi:MAG: histidine phosphatase family protein [Vulcanimicrobiaceae bacterium]